MSTFPTTSPKAPSPAALLTALVEWLAGELARSPVALKLAGFGAVVAGAVPGVLSNGPVRVALVAAGTFLAGIVHLAEAHKAS